MSDPWPTELRLAKDGSTLTIAFDTGEVFPFPAEYLRVMSPSAEVQGHSPDQKKMVSGKEKVAVIRIDPVGNYAVKLTFDDLHDTGLYTWGYLLKLGRERETLWAGYLAELAEKGLSRSR
ncbi:DUF971 family protein [Faunimonas pinastri]|uniref:DUF971 family protein n=1 Tax=Faunimonas pinastri TaxID=1855383 RepID=A0A1H9JGI6_9HYPH|nr:DUF971 domain-containing protein [Faunimonas pinastri]SEQ85930.1 DUF971 family protein [Faunimonas pinastri]